MVTVVSERTQAEEDLLRLGDHEFQGRLIVGTGKYEAFDIMRDALEASGAECVTVAVRREKLYTDGKQQNILEKTRMLHTDFMIYLIKDLKRKKL